MRAQDDIDYTTLAWVKGELDETLKQARHALEAYVEDPSDASQIRFCATYLHQVQGTLRMVELYAAAMVAEEMERLAGALLEGQVGDRDEAYGVLMRGIMQLPDYLERLQTGHRDVPIVLLPLLNDLRAARGEKGLSEISLFTPDLGRELPLNARGPVHPLPEAELRSRAEPLRSQFQMALLKWFRNDDVDGNLTRLTETCDRLVAITAEIEARRLFWVTAGVLEALRAKAFEPSKELKQGVGKVEREIKRLADAGEKSFRSDPPHELTRNLLYFVAHAPTEHGRIGELREVFGLGALLPSQEEVEHARGSLAGHNRSLLDTVSVAIKEDLMRVKDALDLHLRNPGADAAQLGSQIEVLERVSDTLGMLGLGVARRVVLEQRDAMHAVVDGSRPADESSLLDIAGALLYVEASLDEQVQHLGGTPVVGKTEAAMPSVETRRVMQALLKEAQANFTRAKQGFVAYIESGWDADQLKDAPELLDQVAGALRIIELPDAAGYLDAVGRFTERELLQHRRVPDVVQMEALADALASLEYFLEAQGEQRAGRDRILNTARAGLEKLGYWPLPSATQHDTAPATTVTQPAVAVAHEPQVAATAQTPVEPVVASEPDATAALVQALAEPEQAVPDLVEPTAIEAGVSETAAIEPIAAVTPAASVTASAVAEPVREEGPIIGGFEAASEEIDEEIREVFVEEVEEEINNLGELLPNWIAAPADLDQLKAIRRVFHTLKGSGRLVGALTLGEFSWKIENMLNRVLDHTIQPTPAVIVLIEAASNVLPELLAALRGERSVRTDLDAMKTVADRLVAGEQVIYAPPAPEPEPVVEVAIVEEPVIEASEVATPDVLEVAVAEEIEPAIPEVIAADEVESASEEIADTRVPVAAIDSVLFDILKPEVSGHLDTVDAYLASAGEPLSDAVVRAVHTMNGAFAMTDVPLVTELTAPLENYLKRVMAHASVPSVQGMQILRDSVQALRNVLEELDAAEPRLTPLNALAERVIAERDLLPDALGPTVPAHLPIETAETAETPELTTAVSIEEAPAHAADEPVVVAAMESDVIAAADSIPEVEEVFDASALEALAGQEISVTAVGLEELVAEADGFRAEEIIEAPAVEEAAVEEAAVEEAAVEEAAVEEAAVEEAAVEEAAVEEAAVEEAAVEEAAVEEAAVEEAAVEEAAVEEAAVEEAAVEEAALEEAAVEEAAVEEAALEEAAVEEAAVEEAAVEEAAVEEAAVEEAAVEETAVEETPADVITSEEDSTAGVDFELEEAEGISLAGDRPETIDSESAETVDWQQFAPVDEDAAAQTTPLLDVVEHDLAQADALVDQAIERAAAEGDATATPTVPEPVDAVDAMIREWLATEASAASADAEASADMGTLPQPEAEAQASSHDTSEDQIEFGEPGEPDTEAVSGAESLAAAIEDESGETIEPATPVLADTFFESLVEEDSIPLLEAVDETDVDSIRITDEADAVSVDEFEAVASVDEESSDTTSAEAADAALDVETTFDDEPVTEVADDAFVEAQADAVESADAVNSETEADGIDAEAEFEAEETEAEASQPESVATEAAAAEPVVTAAGAAETARQGLVAAWFLAGLDSADPDPEQPLKLPEMDEELLDIFVEEASDILDHSDGLLAQLRAAPTDRDTVVALQRDLHTLKGGARMAGVYAIGDLGHVMESLLEIVADGKRSLPRYGIDVLEVAFDRLNRMQARVASRQALATPVTLVQRVEMLARGEEPELEGLETELQDVAIEETAQTATIVPEVTPMAVADVVPELAPTALDDDDTGVRAPQEQIRIRADLLDRLVNYAGEVAIYRARLEQQLGLFRGNLTELEQTTERLRRQLRTLEIETEAQIIARYQREAEAGGEQTFDPLELDRFSTLQQVSRALSESAADLVSLQGSLEDHTRQYETLLLQQSRVSSDLQEGLMRTRMVPFDSLVPRLRRIIRQTSGELGKKAQLRVEGTQGEMDRSVLDRMTAPLEHMLRNALAHGLEVPADRAVAGKPEEGTIRIAVSREGSEVVIKISDDGRGLDREAIRRKAIDRGLIVAEAAIPDQTLYGFILESGFSTASTVSKIAGRGVGMDVVHNEIRQLGGSLGIDSEHGRGTVFTVRLPFTLAVTQAVFVQQGETSYAVPIASVQGVSRIERTELEAQLAGGEPRFVYAGEDYSIHDLGRLLGQPVTRAEGSLQVPLLLARSGDLRVAICVDNVIGSREIVVKPVGSQVSSIPGIFGATIMGDGRVIVILDVAPLARRYAALHAGVEPIVVAPAEPVRRVPLVMVVDDSITMRKVTGRVLERHGYEVLTAKDGVDAIEKLVERVPDVMLLDIEMPRMDGYELATHIRNDVRLRGIPIIMITSRTGVKHRQRAFEIGVDRYLGKPYQEAELMRNVDEILQVHRGDHG